jgi:hypothetical protein
MIDFICVDAFDKSKNKKFFENSVGDHRPQNLTERFHAA